MEKQVEQLNRNELPIKFGTHRFFNGMQIVKSKFFDECFPVKYNEGGCHTATSSFTKILITSLE